MPALGPAAVAVHDDGHVAGQAQKIDLIEQARFLATAGGKEFRRFHFGIPARFGNESTTGAKSTAKLTQPFRTRNHARDALEQQCTAVFVQAMTVECRTSRREQETEGRVAFLLANLNFGTNL
jgi:hypothetical protein